jgi:diguanylate cyclase (GGDEF)-like protein
MSFNHGIFELAPTVRTNYEVARWIAIQTLFASCFVVPATFLAVIWMCGGDLSRTFSAGGALGFGLCLSLVETLVFTPIVAIRSVSTLRRLNLAHDELDRLAHSDPLTGLLNRRGFDKLANNVATSSGALGRPMAALLCDIDRFKEINDEFGHEFGDAALRHAANLLRSAAERENFALGRQGGDEFVALLPSFTSAQALDLAERLRQTFAAQPVEWNGLTAGITISVGVAGTASSNGRIVELIVSADAALYEAKRDGRNRVAAAKEKLGAAA